MQITSSTARQAQTNLVWSSLNDVDKTIEGIRSSTLPLRGGGMPGPSGLLDPGASSDNEEVERDGCPCLVKVCCCPCLIALDIISCCQFGFFFDCCQKNASV